MRGQLLLPAQSWQSSWHSSTCSLWPSCRAAAPCDPATILRTSVIPGATLVWWPVVYSASRRKASYPEEWVFIRNMRCDPCFAPTVGAHPVPEGPPSHCVAQPVAGDGQGSGLVRQEWRLGVTPAFLLQLGLFSVWAPRAVQRRLSDSSERWVGLCRHGSVAQGCCPGNPNVSEATPGRAFVMFLFLAFTLVSVVLEKHRKP